MEIERGVKLEYGGDLEAGLSAGPRSMDRLPDYTDAELSEGLGEMDDEIARAFQPPSHAEPEPLPSGLA